MCIQTTMRYYRPFYQPQKIYIELWKESMGLAALALLAVLLDVLEHLLDVAWPL